MHALNHQRSEIDVSSVDWHGSGQKVKDLEHVRLQVFEAEIRDAVCGGGYESVCGCDVYVFPNLLFCAAPMFSCTQP